MYYEKLLYLAGKTAVPADYSTNLYKTAENVQVPVKLNGKTPTSPRQSRLPLRERFGGTKAGIFDEFEVLPTNVLSPDQGWKLKTNPPYRFMIFIFSF